MSENKKAGESKEQEIPEPIQEALDAPDTRSEEEKAADNKEADQIKEISEKAYKFFKEEIMTSELPMVVIERLPQYIQGLVKITQGKSKLWAEANKIQEEYYTTPINKLEFYENVEESKEQD